MSSLQHELSVSPGTSDQMRARDVELLLAAKGGSHAAFGELQKTYSSRLYKRIFSITRNREDAEDALQDTFLRAYRALPSFEGRAQLSTWLMRIAINSALMILRKRHARPETSIEPQAGLGDDLQSFDIRDNALNPEQICDQKQRFKAILFAIQKLDPKLRTPIGIWMSEEHSMKDLARQLGVSVAAVKARLHRARKHLIRTTSFRNHRMNHHSQNCGGRYTRAGS
jgi:RNA polymerase sigma-70 factor, ECF subfamily